MEGVTYPLPDRFCLFIVHRKSLIDISILNFGKNADVAFIIFRAEINVYVLKSTEKCIFTFLFMVSKH